MENFEISVSHNSQNYHFEIRDYMHHSGEQCKYEVFKDGQFIVSFEPGAHKILHVCKDAGLVEEEMLHLIAEQLEAFHI